MITNTDGLKLGHFYRNALRGIVLITGIVLPKTKAYEQGFRFVDHRGSFYTERGSVMNTVFHVFDLNEEIPVEEIDEPTLLRINDLVKAQASVEPNRERAYQICRSIVQVASGWNLALGYIAYRTGNRAIGLFGIGTGALGIALTAAAPTTLRR